MLAVARGTCGAMSHTTRWRYTLPVPFVAIDTRPVVLTATLARPTCSSTLAPVSRASTWGGCGSTWCGCGRRARSCNIGWGQTLIIIVVVVLASPVRLTARWTCPTYPTTLAICSGASGVTRVRQALRIIFVLCLAA